MFALPQATTSAVTAVKDGEKSTPTKNDEKRRSLFGGDSKRCPTTPTNMPPKTPLATPQDEAALSSTVAAASGNDESARTWRDIHNSGGSYQVSVSATSSSSSSAQRQAGGEGEIRGVRKKKSFMQTLGLRSRKSSSALGRSTSAETWETEGSSGTTNDAPPLPSSSTAARLLTRKRGKSSPKTPQEHIIQGQDSMASLMSTDSVSSVATVSPFGRSAHLPTPLRVSSTPDASTNQIPAESFPGAVAGDPAELPVRLAPDKGKSSEVSNFSSLTPAYYGERSGRWLADRHPVDDNGQEIESPIAPPVPEKRRMPDEQEMREAEGQAREWARYVEGLRQEVQRQAAREAQDPAPHAGTSQEMESFAARQREHTEDKVKLAEQFVDRTSTYGLMLKDGWQSSDLQGVSVYEKLAEWEKHDSKRDPQMKETVIKRLFNRVKEQFSPPPPPPTKPPLWTDPNTPIITERDVKKDEEGEEKEEPRDDLSDRPLASTPDEEHYQVKGLGITSPSTSSFDHIPPKHPARIAAIEANLAKEAEDTARTESSPLLKAPLLSQSTTSTGSSSMRTIVPKSRSSKHSTPSRQPTPGHTSNYIMSPLLRSVPAPIAPPNQDQSDWESVYDDEVDLDDDLIALAKTGGTTPDLRQKFRDAEDQEERKFQAILNQVPAAPQLSPEMHAKFEKARTLPSHLVARKNSTLVVKRDPTSSAFSPQLDTHEQQAEFDQGIQAAALRRTQKLSKVPVSTNHPALRLEIGDDFGPRSSSLPLHIGKTRPSNIPTPTKAKPPKPVKPSSLAAYSTLSRVIEEDSPTDVTPQMPRPPKYGQHISPGKGLDSPEASAAQNPKSPVEAQMEDVAAAWHGPRTPSLANKPNFDETPSMQEAQEMRRRFGLPLLEFKREGEPPHPNHRYTWDTQNLMCQGIHRGAYEPLDASPSFSDATEASPLRRFGTSATLPPAASHDTFSSIDINFEGKSCHHCRRTCCFYTEQLGIMSMGQARDEAVRVAVEKARNTEHQLRKAFPAGVERFDAHMKCSECGVVCCHQHGVVCSTLSCRAALCERCARWLGGACRKHGEKGGK
ncbi:hypothetical protein CKM354_000253800 [Cercospora kikuchii]|uniref:Uncharacterized protein n=1 Tax=Cercospora kikuchii TaxID=84275 RepID=A0A9P3C9I1_9PEZI|nr:uncharacterized protein CKM354_000253800 [Cercospora kikuchii]GIZ39147.1 hypothetical protein CKM354_000253800 [Cercospora kikuchii]